MDTIANWFLRDDIDIIYILAREADFASRAGEQVAIRVARNVPEGEWALIDQEAQLQLGAFKALGVDVPGRELVCVLEDLRSLHKLLECYRDTTLHLNLILEGPDILGHWTYLSNQGSSKVTYCHQPCWHSAG